MKRIKQLTIAALTLAMAVSLTACDEEVPHSNVGTPSANGAVTTTAPATTKDPDENAETDGVIKDVHSDSFVPSGNAGKITWLGYYDLSTDGSSAEQYKIFTSETYGGEIEYVNCGSGTAYFDKLGTMIAADESPDIVRYEWMSFPYGMSKNIYEPLDGLIDAESALWADMAPIAENFAYKGKHYYYPYRIATNFAINYNRKTLEEASLPDPYDLYLENNWTWDTFKQILTAWCDMDEDNIGYCGTNATSLIATTGKTLVDVQPDGSVKNNINEPEITRAMEFASDLCREGLTYQGELGDWVPPDTWATASNRILFLGMGPEWTYSAASEKIQNPSGVENDIFDTPSDFAFVPFPRDPQSDKYTIAFDTFGYMIPKGAKNISGAVEWINLVRVYQIDEERIATEREEYLHPVRELYTKGKYEGMQKWKLTWDEKVYDLWQDMMNPDKFDFVFDDCFGFTTEMETVVNDILNEPMFHNGSWTQLRAENGPVIDYIISEFNAG